MAGNLSFNDNDDVQIKGATDGTLIGNTGSRLNVDSQISGVTTALSTSFSSKSRVDTVTTPVALSTGSYTAVYSYSGTGFLLGFSLEFNNTSIIPRLQVDGQNVFDTNSLATWGGFLVTTNSTDRRQAGSGIITSGSSLDWSLRQPIRFTTSVIISADANGGVLLSRQLSQAVIYIVKET